MTAVATHSKNTSSQCDPALAVTRSLLGYGVIAGPLYVGVWLAQALTRDGFDLGRHSGSLLSNGDWGWIQIANFVLTGLMTIAAAAGIRRALKRGPSASWVPRLIAVYGAGLIAAGVFVADPAFGFPAGAPAGQGDVTWHGLAHVASGGIAFLSLIAACFAMSRRFARQKQRGWALASRVTGAIYFVAFMGIASGAGSAPVVVGFTLAMTLGWAWLSAVAAHLYGEVAR